MVILIVVVGSQEIRELPVKCNNVERGCNWKGTIGTLKQHMDKCEYKIVPCPNGCKDSSGKDRVVTQKKLLIHLTTQCPHRKHSCQSCGKEGTFENITGEHEKTCEKKTVICSHCRSPMERGLLSKHVKMSCKMAEVACKFESIGCSVTMKRKDVGKHEENNDRAHLKVALGSIVALKKEFTDFKQKLFTLKDGAAIVFRLSDFSNKKSSDDIFCSLPFYTSSEGYKMEIRVYPNGIGQAKETHVSVFVKVLADGLYNDSLPWPFMGSFIIELLNQSADNNHYSAQIHFGQSGSTPRSDRGISKFFPHLDLLWDPSKKTEYLKNDSLYFRITSLVVAPSHKPWLECAVTMNPSLKRMLSKEEYRSANGMTVIKMPTYSYKKSSNETFYSDPFYSSPSGYKFCLNVLANGEDGGKDSHVSVYLRVLKGLYDDSLKWPVTGSVTCELLNQLNDNNHYKWTFKFQEHTNFQVGDERGKASFITHSALAENPSKNTQFVMDDCLYFRVGVILDESNYKPWLSSAQ